MYKVLLCLAIVTLTCSCSISQELDSPPQQAELPYASIPDYPDAVTSGNVLGRMIDGLGYRYYWATDSLTQANLDYRISEDSRSCMETLDHLLGLSKFILSIVENDLSIRDTNEDDLSWNDKRMITLNNFMQSSNGVKGLTDKQVEELKIVFMRGDKKTEFPVWNMINGPIADAIWHCGQVVSFRRASGNPMNPNVSVFSGKNR